MLQVEWITLHTSIYLTVLEVRSPTWLLLDSEQDGRLGCAPSAGLGGNHLVDPSQLPVAAGISWLVASLFIYKPLSDSESLLLP